MEGTAGTTGPPTAGPSRNPYARWFRRAMWLGIVQDWVLGIPAIFAPERTLKAVRQRPTGDPVWTSFAALLVVLLSLFYIPGARDPVRYRATAWLSVFARPPGVLLFLVLRRGRYPLFGIIDAVLFCIQAPLLFLTMRAERRGRSPSAPPPRLRRVRLRRRRTEGAAESPADRRAAIMGYRGMSFNDCKAAAWAGPYDGELPNHRGLTPGRMVEFFNHSARNLIDHRDVIPHFDKLIHSNGICYSGVWRIHADSPYTGYFAKGSVGLLIARGSVAGAQLNAGQRRAYGIAGKIYPTMDPDEVVKPANFVTVTTLSGDKRQHIADYEPTNRPRVGLDPGANFVNRGLFRLVDTRPGWRQLHWVSTLGVPYDGEVVTPDLLMLKVAPGTPRVDAKDFRDELRLEHYPGGRMVYTINVKMLDDREWAEIGTIEFDDYALSDGGDKRLHFVIPRDVPDVAR